MRTSSSRVIGGNIMIPTECVSWRWNGNLGDDMIWAAQERMFGQRLALGQYLESPRAVVVGGGTLIPKQPEHPGLLGLSRSLPTAIFGTGVGDPAFWGTEHIHEWIEILLNSQFIGVRGPLSVERLVSWGLPAERIRWIGDPALYFAESRTPARPFKGRLGVNLGITYGNLYGRDERQVERAMVSVIQELAASGWEISLICAWSPDEGALERVGAAAATTLAVRHWHEDYVRALEEVEDFDLIIAEKLHVSVVAACRGVPFIALNYRSKVMDFCRSIGWTKFCISTENLEPHDVLERVRILTAERDTLTPELQRNVLAVRGRVLDASKEVLGELRDV